MNVEQIINRASTLGAGLDQPSEDDVSVYMGYLNNAHFDLYSLLASLNQPAYLKNSDITLLSNAVEHPLFVHSVHIKGSRNDLKKSFYQDIINIDPFLEKVGIPTHWYTKESDPASWNVFLYPIPKDDPQNVTMRVYYVPQPTELKITDQEAQIPYPAAYHSLLVDGLIYYMVQGEEGFNSTVDLNLYLKRWETRKASLVARYQMTKMPTIRTFSEA